METTRDKNRIILEFDRPEDAEKVQQAIDAQRYLEIVRKSKANEQEIFALAGEIKETWWNENKHRFIK